MARHSLDIVVFKSVSVPLIPLAALIIFDNFKSGEINYLSIITIPFGLLLFSVPYYILSAVGWATWGLLTVSLAKKYTLYIPLPVSIIFSALLLFALLSFTMGVSLAAPLSGVVIFQALAFIWFYRANEN